MPVELRTCSARGSYYSHSHGAAFSVTAKQHGLVIHAVGVSLYTDGQHTLTVHATAGSTAANLDTRQDWSSVGSATVDVTEVYNNVAPVDVPLSSPVFVPAGQTRGIYVHSNTSYLRYACTGSAPLDNADLSVRGVAITQSPTPFSSVSASTHYWPSALRLLYSQ